MSCLVEVYDISDPENPVFDRTETVGDGEASFPAWFVGLKTPMLYQRSGESTWHDVTSTIYIAKDGSLNFKVEKFPTSTPSWPSGFPQWSGVKSGSGETISNVPFSNLSSSATDYKTETAKCGASQRTANVVVYDFGSLTVAEKTYSANSITKPGSSGTTLYVCEQPNNNTKIILSATLTPDIDSEKQWACWAVEGNTASPTSGSFSGGSAEVTLTPQGLNRTFQVKAGLDVNRNGVLDSNEIRQTIEVVVMAISTINIIGKCQDGTWNSATNPSTGEVCFSNDPGVDVAAKLSAICQPNTPTVHQLSLWKISGDSVSLTGGHYSGQPIDVTLSPQGNHEYTLEAGLDANRDGYLQDSEITHTIKIKVLNVKLTVENAGGAAGAVPLTECMEDRWITYTAKIPTWTSFSSDVKYKFCFKKADGTNDSRIKYSNNSHEQTTVIAADKVANSPGASPTHHYFDTTVYAEVTYKGVTAKSNVLDIRVYRLYILKFNNLSPAKIRKVCVGSNIDYEAVASSDCQNWSWEMPDGIFNAWNISGNKKNGTDIKIPYSDLARASNSWFGDTYGSVKVTCKDGDNNMKTFTGSKWIKVFFPPDVNVDGAAPTNDKPPCWFVFWKDGCVVNGMAQFNFTNEMVMGKYSNGQLYLGKPCLNKRYATQLTRKSRTGYPTCTVTVTGNDEYIDAVAGTISHELYHKFTYTHTGTDSDGDMVTDSREVTPEKSYFPITFTNDYDSFDLSNNIFGYSGYTRGDQEFRCRLENIHNKQIIDKSKDWAADNRNPLWK
jgi:hypothetical protein